MQPNVVLVTVDTLRSDHLSANGFESPTTPFIDTLVRTGVFFPNTVAPVPRTTPALASLLTGAYPHTTGVRTLYDRLDDKVKSIAEVFAASGYWTAAVVSNHVLTAERGLGRGFLVYDSAGDARDARSTNVRVFHHLASRDPERPIFLWVHYIDPHVPYRPGQRLAESFDPDYRGRYRHEFGSVAGGTGPRAYPADLPKAVAVYQNPLSAEVNRHVRTLYAADIRGTDDAVGDLVRGLETLIGDDWLIAFTADHGESLGEHDFYYDHGDYVYNASLRVPLVFRVPDSLLGSEVRSLSSMAVGPGRVEDWVSLVDVAPTLMELAGLDGELGSAAAVGGRSLVGEFSRARTGKSLHRAVASPDEAASQGMERDVSKPRPVFAESGHSFFPSLVRRRVTNDVAGRFRAVIHDGWKLIWTPGLPDDQAYELFDLVRDPGEITDVSSDHQDRVAVMRDLLSAWLVRTDASGREPSPDDLRRLRSLGYL